MNSRGNQSQSRLGTALGTTKHRVIGGISQVLLATCGFLTIVGGFSIYQIAARGTIVVSPSPYYDLSVEFNYFKTLGFSCAASSIIFLIFVNLFAYAVSELSRSFHGNQVGAAAIPFALVAFPLNILYSISMYNGSMYYSIYNVPLAEIFVPYNLSYWWLGGIAFFEILFDVLMGTPVALFGASLILNSRHFPISKLWKTAGILYLATAALYFSVVLDFFGAIAAVAAGIVGLACFMKDYTE